MRYGFFIAAAVMLLTGVAHAAREEEDCDADRYREQILGGHLFEPPMFGPYAFPTTHVGFRQGVEGLHVDGYPVDNNSRFNVNAFGVTERIDVGVQFLHRLQLSVFADADVFSGSSIKSIITGGAGFSHRVGGAVGYRLLRKGSSLVSAAFSADFGNAAKADMLQLVSALADRPIRTVATVIRGGVNDLVVNTAAFAGQTLTVAYAQAIGKSFGLQLSGNLTHANLHLKYYSESERAVHDVHTVLWTPEFTAAATYDLAPTTVVPVAVTAEYSMRVTNSQKDWLNPIQTAALGLYYSGRPEMQVGVTGFYTFLLDTTQGIDAFGRPFPNGTPSVRGVMITLRYTW